MTHQNSKYRDLGSRQNTALPRTFSFPLVAVLSLTLILSSCVMTSPTSVEPPRATNFCEAKASLVNPVAKSASVGSGIGGTGAPLANNERGGIGGTGIVAGAKPIFGDGGIGGTGIVGIITGFASICVNGIEVNYDNSTPVWDNGKPSALSQLVVGQVVSVATTGDADQMTARGIGVIQAVVGPITAVNAATGELRVMGQRIQASADSLTGLNVGNWLRVSGHTLATGEVVATLLQAMPAPANGLAQVRSIARDLSGKSVKAGDTSVDLSKLATPVNLANGQEIWASGVWNGQSLLANDIVVNPTLQGLGRVEKVVLEGYIHSSNKLSLSLGTQALTLSDRIQIVGGSRSDLVVNRRVQISGRLGADQRITVERVELSRSSRSGGSGKSSNSRDDNIKSGSGSSGSGSSGSGSSGSGSSGSGSSGSGSSGSGTSGSGSSGSGSSGSGTSGSGSSGSGSSGSGTSGSGSSGSGSSGSGSSGSGTSGSGSSGSGSSGSGTSGSGSSGSGSSGSGTSGSGSSGSGSSGSGSSGSGSSGSGKGR
jgi:Domain of unknown function (DUF5666)